MLMHAKTKSTHRPAQGPPETSALDDPVIIYDSLLEHVKTDRPPVQPISLKQLKILLLEVGNGEPAVLEGANVKIDALLLIMAQSSSPNQVWEAYRNACNKPIQIPPDLLDRVARVVIRTYAPTRSTFLRLHEILGHLQRLNQPIKRWQWNSLIYHSALGLRRVHTQDYQSALDIYREMLSSRAIPQNAAQSTPDIYTYTTLLYIAVRTGEASNVDHAYSLLRASNLPLDRVARLAMIPYFVYTKNLKAVRNIAKEFSPAKEDIGIDGINAYMWAFGKMEQLDVVREIYNVLRANISRNAASQKGPPSNMDSSFQSSSSPTPNETYNINRTSDFNTDVQTPTAKIVEGPHPGNDCTPSEPITIREFTAIDGTFNGESTDPSEASSPTSRRLKRARVQINGDLVIWETQTPNNITYTICIQLYAYFGDLRSALQIFRDMIATIDTERPWLSEPPQKYRPLHKVYRALFLGFARHARSPPEDDLPWKKDALYSIFTSFLQMDADQFKPNDRTILWIMQGFADCTNNDEGTLIWVWNSLEERFGPLRDSRYFAGIIRLARECRSVL